VFLGESMKERHRGVAPTAAVHIHFQQELWFRVDRSVEPLFLAINVDLLCVNLEPWRRDRRWVALLVGKRLFLVPDRLMIPINTQPPQDGLGSRSDNPIDRSRIIKQRTGVGVPSFSQATWFSTSNRPLSRSASSMISSRYDFLASQTP
jgi:hypothetical protein